MQHITEDTGGKISVQHGDKPTSFVLVICVIVCIFCLRCLRVLWPSRFKGKCHSMVSIVIVIVRGEDVDCMVGHFLRLRIDVFGIAGMAVIVPLCVFLVSVADYDHFESF